MVLAKLFTRAVTSSVEICSPRIRGLGEAGKGLSDETTMRGGAPCEGLAPNLAAMRRRKTMQNKVVFILSETRNREKSLISPRESEIRSRYRMYGQPGGDRARHALQTTGIEVAVRPRQ